MNSDPLTFLHLGDRKGKETPWRCSFYWFYLTEIVVLVEDGKYKYLLVINIDGRALND